MRIIEQNILNCDSWTCAREAQMSGQYKGYLFLRFSVHKLVSLFGFSNNLQSAWVSLSLVNGFFLACLFFIFERTKIGALKSTGLIGALLLGLPFIQYQMIIGEDNLVYYGILLLYFTYFLNEEVSSWALGCLLGLAIFFHISPFVFLGTLVLVFFKDKRRWALEQGLCAFFLYHLLHILLYLDQFFIKPLDVLLDENLVADHLLGVLTFSQAKAALGFTNLSYFGLLKQGALNFFNLYLTKDIFYISLASLFLLLLLLIRYASLLKEERIKGLVLGGCSIVPILLYRPGDPERWDFLILLMISLTPLVWMKLSSKKDLAFCSLMLLLGLYNSYGLYFDRTDFQVKKKQLGLSLEEINQIKPPFIYPIQFLNIDPLVLLKHPHLEGEVYFHDKKNDKYYQTKLSIVAREGHFNEDSFNDWFHFGMWNRPFESISLLDVREVSLPKESAN